LFGQVAIDGPATNPLTLSTLLQKMEEQNRGETSDEMEFLIGKSIDVLKDLLEHINQLKIMAVQMNGQIHQFDPRSRKVRQMTEMLLKLMDKHAEVERAFQDYLQMLQDLPLTTSDSV